jgi:hypothetical protein
MEQIKGSDIVYLAEDTLYNVVQRTKEYGILGTLNIFKPITMGLVCEYNGAKVIIKFGKTASVVPLHLEQKNIKEVYRHNNYSNEFASLDLQDSAMAMFANPEQYKSLRKASKGNIGAIMVYILTSSRVRYPVPFAEFDFKNKDLLSVVNGFNRIL